MLHQDIRITSKVLSKETHHKSGQLVYFSVISTLVIYDVISPSFILQGDIYTHAFMPTIIH